MSYCSNCGNRLGDNDKFCPQCGAPVGQQDDSRHRSHFDGELHKCPKCGETLNSFVTNCPSCGYEIRGSKGISVVKELADRINQVNTLEEKNELISNFYIPNTKEDIIDFFILATSNIDAGSPCLEAWYSKLDQAYQKAQLLLGNSQEFEHMNDIYHRTKKKRKTKAFISLVFKSSSLRLFLIAALGVFLTVLGMFLGSLSDNPDSPFYYLGIIGMLIFMYCLLIFMCKALFKLEKSKK